ncbi:hypothetical protein SELMODRAFT_128208 [Selaginella moellendorffii]|uniref:Uncharacterized protein CDKE-2 n=1 Tax=Selaginella moellendorffii TaxID=88036 RepID=D8SZ08_SELML|nr:hypothetical protein SELMODRAFT_128208 [Selaginella moellendorffii]
MADGIAKRARPAWLQQYELLGKIGEGTYGLVYLAKSKLVSNRGVKIAIKKFKQSKEGDGVSPTAIREIMLLRECMHENVVKLVDVHINHADMSLYLAFEYAEHDLYEIIRHHREKLLFQINPYTVKSLLWQILNGINYLHSNWIIHRDLKPSNILVMSGDGDEQGLVKIGDFGLARIYQAPLKPLSDNGVVVTIWYRAPELLLGAKHYTCAVDMWAVGCIFAELLTLKPLFQGAEDKTGPNPFQLDQLDKIFKVLGHPTTERWPMLSNLPHWLANRQLIQSRKYDNPGLHTVVNLQPKGLAFDLLSRMLEYDPVKRITAAQALDHEYFRSDPLPGRNALVYGQPGEKVVQYPARPVDSSTDFEGSGSIQNTQMVRDRKRKQAFFSPLQCGGGSSFLMVSTFRGSQMSTSNSLPASAASAAAASATANAVRPMHHQQMPLVGMQRLQTASMGAFNVGAQPAMAGLAANMFVQRGQQLQQVAHHQQQQQQQQQHQHHQHQQHQVQKLRSFFRS